MVDCTGLENRQAERPREFESHPLRQLENEQHWLGRYVGSPANSPVKEEL